MQFGMWDSLFNLVILLFWVRLWTPEDRGYVFNPYLAPVGRASDAVMNFLRPVFFRTPTRLVALVCLLFLLAFRAVAVPLRATWLLSYGLTRAADTESLRSCLSLSALSFAVFLLRLWVLALLYVRASGRRASRHTTETLDALCRPFTALPLAAQPALLLLAGMLAAAALDAGGLGLPQLGNAAMPIVLGDGNALTATGLLRLALVALRGAVDVLPVIRQVVLALIVGSWIGLFTGSVGVAGFCRDWLDLFLGPLRDHPIRIGAFDLSPLVFFFGLGLVYPFLAQLLSSAYAGLL